MNKAANELEYVGSFNKSSSSVIRADDLLLQGKEAPMDRQSAIGNCFISVGI